jgi:hypothetical protein
LGEGKRRVLGTADEDDATTTPTTTQCPIERLMHFGVVAIYLTKNRALQDIAISCHAHVPKKMNVERALTLRTFSTHHLSPARAEWTHDVSNDERPNVGLQEHGFQAFVLSVSFTGLFQRCTTQ